MKRFIYPSIFDDSNIVSAVSTRCAGTSEGNYSSLNLGRSTADNQNHVEQNRKLFFEDLGITENEVSVSYQVHGCEILNASEACRTTGFDALITNKKGLFLVVSIADCVPVLIHDPVKNVVAAVHAGWRGTVAEIVLKTIEKMKNDYGTEAVNCKVFIGPCISFDHFETGKGVADQFSDDLKRFENKTGKFFVDLKTANKKQALQSGVLMKNIEISPYCTFRDQELFFSHRRDKGITGRMVAVIGMK